MKKVKAYIIVQLIQFAKLINKLFNEQWIIGLAESSIVELLNKKGNNTLNRIKWLMPQEINTAYADPFICEQTNAVISTFIEEFSFNECYGWISKAVINTELHTITTTPLLKTGKHMSYPFIYKYNNQVFVFPESSKSLRVDCYLYNEVLERLDYVSTVLEIPLLDPTILYYNKKYWLFGTINNVSSNSELHIYYSDTLSGKYIAHKCNPVKSNLASSRPAGSFIQLDGEIYRPSQFCKKNYGEHITINKVLILDESKFIEEEHCSIHVNPYDFLKYGIYKIHTININNNTIVLDGARLHFNIIKRFYNFSKFYSMRERQKE